MNHLESLCIRYVGQNSSIIEGSDVELNELQEMLDSSWIVLRNMIIAMTNNGTFHKLGKKSKILKLTAVGWKKFDSLMNTKCVGRPDQLSPTKEQVVSSAPTINVELNMKRLHIKIGDVIKPVADWKVGDFKLAESLELVGDCVMSSSQDKYYGRWQDKFTNWESFPRK